MFYPTLILSPVGTLRPNSCRFSPCLAFAVISNVIWVMMVKRARKTGKLMPAAPVGALALGMAFFYVFQMTKATKANFKPTGAAEGSVGATTVDKKKS